MHYYNENNREAAAWLRELMKAGEIPAGVIDERSICDVQPNELSGYVQCHFFAGIGGWPLALRLAGWPEDRPVWTGSCPCQPFSVAGKRKGKTDERHLWPVFGELIRAAQPAIVFGEQVASKDGREWLAGVFADLEGMGYQGAGADLCAAGVGEKTSEIAESETWLRKMAERAIAAGNEHLAGRLLAAAEYVGGLIVGSPHIRQRLWWMAYSAGQRWHGSAGPAESPGRPQFEIGGGIERLANLQQSGLEGFTGNGHGGHQSGRNDPVTGGSITTGGAIGRVAKPNGGESGDGNLQRSGEHGQFTQDGGAGFWSRYDILPCRDHKARRVESGTFPLAHGVPGRVGLLRGYGNAIVPPLAALFIQASVEALGDSDEWGVTSDQRETIEKILP